LADNVTPEKLLEDYFKVTDQNHDGKVSLEEITEAWRDFFYAFCETEEYSQRLIQILNLAD